MEENVNGCYAQKPIKSINRIIEASSKRGELVTDFFSHSGTTLISSELTNRRCYTIDIDPVFCEISIRRLERLRKKEKPAGRTQIPLQMKLIEAEKLNLI